MWIPLFWCFCFLCSVRRGRDEDRSSEESLIGETAANAFNASWPEEIHQVSSHFYNSAMPFSCLYSTQSSCCRSPMLLISFFFFFFCFAFTRHMVYMLCTVCNQQIQRHDISLRLWCQSLSFFTRTSSSFYFLLSSSHFSLNVHKASQLSVVPLTCSSFCFSLSLDFLSPFFSLHPSVHSYLWSFPIYYC